MTLLLTTSHVQNGATMGNSKLVPAHGVFELALGLAALAHPIFDVVVLALSFGTP